MYCQNFTPYRTDLKIAGRAKGTGRNVQYWLFQIFNDWIDLLNFGLLWHFGPKAVRPLYEIGLLDKTKKENPNQTKNNNKYNLKS